MKKYQVISGLFLLVFGGSVAAHFARAEEVAHIQIHGFWMSTQTEGYLIGTKRDGRTVKLYGSRVDFSGAQIPTHGLDPNFASVPQFSDLGVLPDHYSGGIVVGYERSEKTTSVAVWIGSQVFVLHQKNGQRQWGKEIESYSVSLPKGTRLVQFSPELGTVIAVRDGLVAIQKSIQRDPKGVFAMEFTEADFQAVPSEYGLPVGEFSILSTDFTLQPSDAVPSGWTKTRYYLLGTGKGSVLALYVPGHIDQSFYINLAPLGRFECANLATGSAPSSKN